MFADLETEVDVLRKELYKDHEPLIKELPPIDLNRTDKLKERFVKFPIVLMLHSLNIIKFQSTPFNS